MKLGMLSWSGINMPWYKFCPIWGRFGYMLLTNRSFSTSMMVFGWERPTFGDETISIASYCFQKFYRVNVEQQDCCVIFGIFRGSFGHFYALIEFSTHAHALMRICWLKIQICVLGCILRSHVRNGNECQTPCHRHSAANIEIPGF